MKPILYRTILFLFAASSLLSSCKEIEDSIEKTRHPKPERKIETAKELPAHENEASSSTIVITETETETISEKEENTTSIFADAEKLDRIQTELKNLPQFKGKDLKLYQSLHFYDYKGGQISINIQNPDTAENIDTYLYAYGKWQEPQPVKISGPNVKQVDFLMPLNEIKFSTAKKVFDQSIETAKDIPGASKIQFVYFTFINIKALNRKHAKWYTMVNGSRKNVSLNFDINGDPELK